MRTVNLIFISLFTITLIGCNTENSNNESDSSSKDNPKEVNTEQKSDGDKKIVSTDNNIVDKEISTQVQDNNGNSETIIELVPTDKDSTTIVVIINEPAIIEDVFDFHKYEKLNSLLKKYVTYSGKVNYSGIKSDVSSLNAVLKELQNNYPESNWSKNQKLSYWINAYNIYTIKLIVDNYPTTSITKITEKPWHKKFIKLNGSTLSLNHIENEIIRKKFNEPRIHFALNCASKSCPVLLNTAYTPGNIQSKLTSQTKRFLNDSSKNKFEAKEIYISKIFEWYKEDFTKNGTVIDFINKYRTEQMSNPTIKYSDYSWDLNK